MAAAWMVRAGEGCEVIEEFEKQSCVAIGWHELGDISGVKTAEELRSLMDRTFPEWKPRKRQVSTSMVFKFLHDFSLGDFVASYNSDTRQYLIGTIAGEHVYDTAPIPHYPNIRQVTWTGKVDRDDLTVESRNSLGAICTLFALNHDVVSELSALAEGKAPVKEPEADEAEFDSIRQEVIGRSHEFIKDLVQKLDWDEMQELVAGILRAMGYKTTVSPKGSDRGKDIVASPDGLGLDQPRIRVEVKHRPKDQMGAPQVRSFIGALRQNDKGLYVSSGGFSREAHYEAERAQVPVTLLDLDDVVGLLTQHYENVDINTRTLVPLRKVYWPASS